MESVYIVTNSQSVLFKRTMKKCAVFMLIIYVFLTQKCGINTDRRGCYKCVISVNKMCHISLLQNDTLRLTVCIFTKCVQS